MGFLSHHITPRVKKSNCKKPVACEPGLKVIILKIELGLNVKKYTNKSEIKEILLIHSKTS